MSILVYKQRHRHPNRKGTPGANYGHVRYIATRPGVLKNEGMGHGLFGKMEPGALTCFADWRDVAKQAYADAKKGCIMYRGVVSFAPQTAKELMLEDQRNWQRYIENHILTIAGKNGIRREHLKWAAAVHGEKGHPHLHVVFWDSSDRVRNPFTPPETPDAVRKQMIKDTFSKKILAYGKEKDAAADGIRRITDGMVEQFENAMRRRIPKKYRDMGQEQVLGGEPEGELFFSEKMLLELTRRMAALKSVLPKQGRLSYRLLPPESKAAVDALAEYLLGEVPQLRHFFDRYVDAKCRMAFLYGAEAAEDRRDTYRQEAGKILGNRILSGVKILNRLEQEAKTAAYRAEHRERFACMVLLEILDALAQAAHREEDAYAACRRNGGELSREARKELFLKNQDKGYEH